MQFKLSSHFLEKCNEAINRIISKKGIRWADTTNYFLGQSSAQQTEQIYFRASRQPSGQSKLVSRQAVSPADKANLFLGKPSARRTKQTCFWANRPPDGQSESLLGQTSDPIDGMDCFWGAGCQPLKEKSSSIWYNKSRNEVR